MFFNTLEFLVFFAVVFTCYYMPFTRPFQVLVLVLGSLCFYFQGAHHLTLLLVVSIAVNCAVSFATLSRIDDAKRTNVLVAAGIIFNVAVLCFFKYGSWILATVSSAINQSPESLPFDIVHFLAVVAMPIGISFYCFEGISLVVDSARGKCDKSTPASHLRNTSLFIAFFPHLIAGPILRAADFFPQIKTKYFRDIDWYNGIKWITLGYFLKVFVADNLADCSNHLTYPSTLRNGAVNNLILLCGYSAQIFADFAGYSYVALGLAILLGYSIPNNFNAPYLSRSLGEFWSRWHISLSSWIRDYLFIPLGGSRCVWYRAAFNLMLVMLIGGLWHGADWNFALWGLFHGAGLIVEHLIIVCVKLKDNLVLSFLRRLATFTFVTLGWIAFIVPDSAQLGPFILSIFANPAQKLNLGGALIVLFFALPVILLHAYYWNQEHHQWCSRILGKPIFKALVFGIMIFLIFFNSGPHYAFIYFQF